MNGGKTVGMRVGGRMLAVLFAFCLVLSCLVMSGGEGIAVEAAATTVSTETIDFVLALDCSGTMEQTDINKICATAAKMFTDLSPAVNTRFSLILFGENYGSAFEYKSDALRACNETNSKNPTYWRKYVSLGAECLDANTYLEKHNVKSAISSKYTAEGTATVVGSALTAAVDVLYRNNADDAVIILVSDGRLSGLTRSDKNNNNYRYDNAELIDLAVSKTKWPIYSIEMDSDNGNSNYTNTANYGGSSWGKASALFQQLTSQTGSKTFRVGSKNNLDATLVEYFFNIYNDFMGTSVYADPVSKKISNYKASFDLTIPEVASETNIVVTGAKIASVSLNYDSGKVLNYSSEGTADDGTFFVKNEDNKYSLLKLIRPEAGKATLTVSCMDSDGTVTTQSSTAQDLPAEMTASPASGTLCLNDTVEFRMFLADNNGNAVKASEFYAKNASANLIVNGTEVIPMEPTEYGYTYTYQFEHEGKYTFGSVMQSDFFRRTGSDREKKKTIENAYQYTVKGYEFSVDASNAQAVRSDSIKIRASFKDPINGKVKSGIYENEEAFLTVKKDGKGYGSSIPMNAETDAYVCNYQFDSYGEYTFCVTTDAACLHGSSMSAETGTVTVSNFGFEAKIEEQAKYSREGKVVVKAWFTRPNGSPISLESLYGNQDAVLQAYKNGKEFGAAVPMTGDGEYAAEVVLDGCDTMFYRVTTKAAHLGQDSPMTAETQTITVNDYVFMTYATLTSPDGKSDNLTLGEIVQGNKNSTIELQSSFEGLVYPDGSIQYGNPNLVHYTITDSSGKKVKDGYGWTMEAVNIESSGEYTLTITYSDGVGQDQSNSYGFELTNRFPGIFAMEKEAQLYVAESYDIPLTCFSDADNDPLTITVDVSMAPDFQWEMGDDAIKIHAGVKSSGESSSYPVTITAADKESASVTETIQFKVINRPLEGEAPEPISHTIGVPGVLVRFSHLPIIRDIVAKDLPVISTWLPIDAYADVIEYNLNDYVNDPDGLTITYTLEWINDKKTADILKDNVSLTEDGILVVDIPGINQTGTSDLLNGTLTICAKTAADDETLDLPLDIHLSPWAHDVNQFIIAVVIIGAVFIALIAFIYNRFKKIKRLKVDRITLVPDGKRIGLASDQHDITSAKINEHTIYNTVVERSTDRATCNDYSKGAAITISRKLLLSKTLTIKIVSGHVKMLKDNNSVELKKGQKIKLKKRTSITLTLSNGFEKAVEIILINKN